MSGKHEHDQYLLIKKKCRGEEKVKGSRFIATAVSVNSEEDAAKFINEIRKEFHDATHNCWAWRVGLGKGSKYRYNDDGEPSGTAGHPIFRAIESTGYSNICMVVTRYFGGTKLGTGGLTRAYGQTALNLLRSSESIKKFPTQNIEFALDFDFANIGHHIINSFSAELEDSQYGEKILFKVNIRASKLDDFKNKLIEATNGQVEFR